MFIEVMELINDEVGIHIHAHLASFKATYDIFLAGIVEREALEAG